MKKFRDVCRRLLSIALNLFVVCMEPIALPLSWEMGQAQIFTYYTEDSNIFAAAVCTLVALWQLRCIFTGGELPALVLIDTLARMLPGVLPENLCFEEESHFNGLLEYPQYTRPVEFRGRKVPDVLLSGHHGNIDKWRREQSLKRTLERRPDLIETAILSKEDEKYLKKLKKGLHESE